MYPDLRADLRAVPRSDRTEKDMEISEKNELHTEGQENRSGKTKDCVTAGVLAEFSEFCRFPHGSGNERQIADYLAERLRKEGLFPETDGAGNLICDIPADDGCECAPLTILQGHMDMVCAALDDSYCPETDPIIWILAEDGEDGRLLLKSDGRSSLGADCGLGNAVLLWSVFSGSCKHGPLRLLFTVEEEVGLAGAKKVETSVFDDARYVINVDGFRWGRLVAGSASGSRETYTADAGALCFHSVREKTMSDSWGEPFIALEIALRDFQSGHSGYDIARGRGNAIRLLNSLLSELMEREIVRYLAAYNGGCGHNVIPGDASAVVVIRKKDQLAFQEAVRRLMGQILEEYRDTDPDGTLCYNETALPEYVLAKEDGKRLVDFIGTVHDGVLHWMEELPGIPDTSSNLGMVRCCARELCRDSGRTEIRVMTFARSMTPKYHDEVLREHRQAAEKYGFRDEISEYGVWRFDSRNPLIRLMKDACRTAAGTEPEVTAEHVGLEPSVFCEKADHLHMINVGADIIDPHTVHERVHVDTIRPFALTMAEVLSMIGKEREQKRR